jgi:Rhodopirellula transposase DDE domain
VLVGQVRPALRAGAVRRRQPFLRPQRGLHVPEDEQPAQQAGARPQHGCGAERQPASHSAAFVTAPNGGREYQPAGRLEQVRVHDFMDKELGKAIPYGIYDVSANTGWVSVGTDHDTSAFAVATLRSWWESIGKARYPNADKLLICADGGGSNGSRVRAWKSNSLPSPLRAACTSRSATCRREPRNGTASSTDCSPRSP